MDDIKEKIKQALRHIWINKYRLFFCLLTLCCLFGLVHYFKSADSATASLSFNYSEAALGMNHIWTSSTAASNASGDRFDQVSSVCSCFLCLVCYHGN